MTEIQDMSQQIHWRNTYMSPKIHEGNSNMSPKIRGTEIYFHGFLEIPGPEQIIVSRILRDI